MIQKTLPVLFFLLLFFQSFAQDILEDQYHVHLRDGSLIKGKILYAADEEVELQLTSGETITILRATIDRISKQKKTNRLLASGVSVQEKGTYQVMMAGALIGKGSGEFEPNTETPSVFNYICGYQWNQYVSLGAGFGLDFYDGGFIPVQLDYRAYFLPKKVGLYTAVGAGYSFSFDQIKKRDNGRTYKGGLLLHPAIGMRVSTRSSYSFLFEVGYRFQYAQREFSWSSDIDNIIYKRLALRVGVCF